MRLISVPPTAKDFERALEDIFKIAQEQGKPHMDVKSGDLHKKVGAGIQVIIIECRCAVKL